MPSCKITASVSEIDSVASKIKAILPSHCIVFLNGDLGSGKTTLVQAMASACGINSDVTSPTFGLQHVYSDTFFHYDLYRMETQAIMEMGLFEEFDRVGWHFIEWGDGVLRDFLDSAGYNTYTIDILQSKKGTRDYYLGDICTL